MITEKRHCKAHSCENVTDPVTFFNKCRLEDLLLFASISGNFF